MKFKHYFILSTMLIVFPVNLVSQEASIIDTDKVLLNNYFNYISAYKADVIEDVLEQTALFFQGAPYVANTLDLNKEESLVVNLREMDCVTFVENVLALSLSTYNDSLSEEYFLKKLTEIRYRNKVIKDYSSRLHYTSDWIFENQKDNLLQNISQTLGGIKETKQINFMSSHQSAYKQLVNDDAMLSKITQTEKIINDRGGFYYLPKDLIEEKAKDIPHMAVIGIVTAIDGLDTSHIGFAYHEKGRLTFLHASSTKQKVVIDDKTLSEYCLSQKNCKGIIVAKVNETYK